MMPVDRLEAIPDSLNTSYFTSIASSYGEHGSPGSAIPEVRQLLVISFAACLAAALAMASLAPLVARILFRGGGAWQKEYLEAKGLGIPVINFWAFDHFNLYNLDCREPESLATAQSTT